MRKISTFHPVGFAIAIWLMATSAAHAFYNPIVGRWLNRDPLGEEGGQNLYGFALNDAQGKHDPLGFRVKVTKVDYDPTNGDHGSVEIYDAKNTEVVSIDPIGQGQVPLEARDSSAGAIVWARLDTSFHASIAGSTMRSAVPTSLPLAFSSWLKGTITVCGCCPDSNKFRMTWTTSAGIRGNHGFASTSIGGNKLLLIRAGQLETKAGHSDVSYSHDCAVIPFNVDMAWRDSSAEGTSGFVKLEATFDCAP